MKYRKKLYCFFAGLLMVLNLSACNLESAIEKIESGADNIMQNEAEAVETIHLMTGNEYENLWDDVRHQQLASADYSQIQLDDCCEDKFPDLALALSELNQLKTSDILETYNDMCTQAVSEIENTVQDFQSYKVMQDVYVRRSDSVVLSLLYNTFCYSGGVDTGYNSWGENFHVKTGKKLELKDVVADMNGLPALVKTQIDKYWNADELYEDVDLNEYFSTNYEYISWVLDYNGITFFFNPEEIVPYASGIQTVTLSFAEYPDLIKKEYREIPDSYGVELSLEDSFYYDLDKNGQIDELTVSGRMSDYDLYEKHVINWNDNCYEIDVYCYDIDPVLVHAADGNNYLYIMDTADNDWRTITVYSFSNGSLYKPGTVDLGWHIVVEDYDDYLAMEMVLTDPTDFKLDARTDMLSTLSGYKNYYVSANGLPESADQWYTLEREIMLTVLYPMKGKVVDDITGEELGEITLKAGDFVLYYRTDNASYADVKLQDGTVVRLTINDTGWPRMINGIDIQDAFDGMLFAG